ncbi:AMP-binding protein [Methanobrevibacter sp. DSM 116169]|uniref:AMP-binding protein n=1 Tax=Methanobrevibacter sp. DSM 116169 TaxID=3242727 RepID=UPI0038FCA377
MSSLIKNFVKRVDYDSYEDFKDNFEFNIPDNFNFGFDVVDKYAEIDPEKIALRWTNGDEKHVFTFEDMKKYSNKVANLIKSYGIKSGDKVMITLKNRYEFWFTLVALHKIGAVAIPATHMLKLKDIKFRLEKANVKMVISIDEDDLIADYTQAQKDLDMDITKIVIEKDIEDWHNFDEEMSKMSDEFEREYINDNNDAMIIFFSSGTTGLPKMVEHNYLYPFGHIITAKYWHNVVENGIHHTTADTGWGKAVWGNIYGQWVAGSSVFIYDYERFHGDDFLRRLTEEKVTTFCAPPTIYRLLINEDLSKYNFENLTYVTTAGEPLPEEVSNKFEKITGLRIKEGFGQTETTLAIATFIWLDPKPNSVGKPAPIFDIELLDTEDNIVDVGNEGEITFNVSDGIPPGLFKEYYKDKEKTDKVWYDNHYHCGDTAWKDEDGYFHFVGRNDDIIKSSGYRIGPYEVENALISHKAVLNCAVTGYPDEIRGQIVKATVILTEEYEASEELIKDIQNHVKHVTAPYKYPRKIEFVEEIPETISGKIRRIEIRNKDENL